MVSRAEESPVNDSGQVVGTGTVEHPEGGSIEMPGNPIKLSAHEDSYGPPPLLGQHTDEVLRGVCGKTDADLKRLRASGAIA